MDINPLLQDPEKAAPNRLPLVLIAVCVVGISLLVVYLEFGPKPAPKQIELTDAAKEYASQLHLLDVQMAAKTDLFNQKLVEITGKIQNGGHRGLKVVEVLCVFHDRSGNAVLQQRSPIVSEKMGGLAPGDTKSFRLPFDSIPESWDEKAPQLLMAAIEFQ